MDSSVAQPGISNRVKRGLKSLRICTKKSYVVPGKRKACEKSNTKKRPKFRVFYPRWFNRTGWSCRRVGFVIKRIDTMTLNYDKYKPTRGGSFLSLSKWVQNKKACINIKKMTCVSSTLFSVVRTKSTRKTTLVKCITTRTSTVH